MQNPYDVIANFSSLDELFDLMESAASPQMPFGGSVRLHPGLLPPQDVGALVAARARLEQLGLRLIVTPAVGTPCVELRRHSRPVSTAQPRAASPPAPGTPDASSR